MESLRYFLITFRPHIAESSILDDFLTIFLQSTLITSSRHSWCVDNEGTMEQHVHMIIQGKYKDKYAFERSKAFREATGKIQDYCKGKQTTWKHAFDCKLVGDTQEDYFKTLGYVNKELYDRPRNGKKDISDKEILDAVEYYYTSEHLDKSKFKKSDWKYVNTKNAHALIENFVEKNDDIKSFSDWKLQFEMIKAKHSFCQLTERNKETIFDELCIAHGQPCNAQGHMGINFGLQGEITEEVKDHYILYLQQVVKGFDPDYFINHPGISVLVD